MNTEKLTNIAVKRLSVLFNNTVNNLAEVRKKEEENSERGVNNWECPHLTRLYEVIKEDHIEFNDIASAITEK